jgi:predicted ArsR family transcriptional regulator
MAEWDGGLHASTKGRIIALLRRKGHTVEELAQALDLTQNAVRFQLSTLQRDGLVQPKGSKRGGTKPAIVYRLTSRSEQLFPKAYEIALRHLVALLLEQFGPEESQEMLRAVGRRISQEQGPGGKANPGTNGDALTRVERAVQVLNSMGGLMEVEEHGDAIYVCGYSCPLAAVSSTHRQGCKLLEALLEDLVGMPVRERCEQSEDVACWFEISLQRREDLPQLQRPPSP